MEAAAKTVEVLSKRILPKEPHHLCASTTWRYRPVPGQEADSRNAGRAHEEWHNTRLQYLTFSSEADRGLLFTRPYYDMREEPTKPVPREVSALAKAAGAGEKKKKLSLSDYRNKKTGAAASASPPEPFIAKKKDSERAVSATSTPTHVLVDGAKTSREPKRPDASKTRELVSPSSLGVKAAKPMRDSLHAESRLPPKPASLPPRPPSPAVKRPMLDAADDDRSTKRPRSDDRRAMADDRAQSGRDNLHRRRDRILPAAAAARDRDAHASLPPPPREERGNPASSSLPNGRSSVLKGGATAPTSRSTPPMSSRPNGVRASTGTSSGIGNGTGNGISTGTGVAANASSRTIAPTKPDVRAHVPPLLSPLHPSLDDPEKRPRPVEGDRKEVDRNSNREKKRLGDADEVNTAPKAKAETALAIAKKPRPSISIPPLLSPTLPPAVEDELRRRKKSSSESSDERPKDHNNNDRDASGRTRGGTAAEGDDEEDMAKPASSRLGHRRRLLISLLVPKSLRPSFARIIRQHPPVAHRKDSQSQSEREYDRAPRTTNDDGDATQQPQARKRPLSAVDGGGGVGVDTTPLKRPRTSDASGYPRLGTPSTPSKKPTDMSRVSSTNSATHTPLDHRNSTPSTSTDRRPNGSSSSAGPTESEQLPAAQLLRSKEERLRGVGKKLKHQADVIMRNYRGASASSMKGKPGEIKVKLGYVLSLESIIAFMMAFHSSNVQRALHHKVGDIAGWSSMFPLMEFLQKEMRQADFHNHQPLYALALMLHAVSLDEIVKCLMYHENPIGERPADNIIVHERRKYRMWHRVSEANTAVHHPRLRIDLHPWSTLDDVTDASLRLLRLYCAEERIEWTQEQVIKDCWPIGPNPIRR